mmetsp:Transcript_25273/g.58944  ORF Transcript_25273/g.58944 Transcript_25273/m.58944 type:complete len:275 (+) Transcript_25273:134-958(+)
MGDCSFCVCAQAACRPANQTEPRLSQAYHRLIARIPYYARICTVQLMNPGSIASLSVCLSVPARLLDSRRASPRLPLGYQTECAPPRSRLQLAATLFVALLVFLLALLLLLLLVALALLVAKALLVIELQHEADGQDEVVDSGHKENEAREDVDDPPPGVSAAGEVAHPDGRPDAHAGEGGANQPRSDRAAEHEDADALGEAEADEGGDEASGAEDDLSGADGRVEVVDDHLDDADDENDRVEADHRCRRLLEFKGGAARHRDGQPIGKGRWSM